MKKHEIIIILSILSMHYNFSTTTKVQQEKNDPIRLRIRHLKHELLKDISQNHNSDEIQGDYVENSNEPITPISEHDKRKLDGKYKLPQLKPTTTEKYVASPEIDNLTATERPLSLETETSSSMEYKHQHNTKKNKLSQRSVMKPKVEIFYRKHNVGFDISQDTNKPQKWTHCLDLLSPFLNGYDYNVTSSHKHVDATDVHIRRLQYLLTLNVTDFTTDEIRSTLFELSNIPMRIYHWDISAVKAIINAVVRGGSHDFKGLKYGLKELFSTWKLNTSNITGLLSQSRIFRPPCIKITDEGGSTVSDKAVRFSKPDINYDKARTNTYSPKTDDC